MQEQNSPKKVHTLTIDQKKKLKVSGVESVLAFSSMRITLNLSDGNRLFIAGNALKITAFSKESGDFETVGEITSVSYGGRMGSKLFK